MSVRVPRSTFAITTPLPSQHSGKDNSDPLAASAVANNPPDSSGQLSSSAQLTSPSYPLAVAPSSPAQVYPADNIRSDTASSSNITTPLPSADHPDKAESVDKAPSRSHARARNNRARVAHGSLHQDRRSFIGGSDARIIMGNDEAKLVRLWREKRGEIVPEDLSDNLVVQLGTVTEDLNRNWYERNTGHTVKDVQRRVHHRALSWMAATLDGVVMQSGAVFEAKFMLPWTFSEETAAEKHMAQLQHNMWVVGTPLAALSIITGGGKWVELTITADPLYQHLLITAEKAFWRCVKDGQPPRLFGVEAPRPRLEAVRVVDMSASNSWAEFAGIYRRTRPAFHEHEAAKADLKKLVPENAKEAVGHGVRAKRAKNGAISFELFEMEAADAPRQ